MENKKKYLEPKATIIEFSNEDVILTSPPSGEPQQQPGGIPFFPIIEEDKD